MSMDIGCKGQKTLALVTIASLGGMSHSWGKLSVTHLLNLYPISRAASLKRSDTPLRLKLI